MILKAWSSSSRSNQGVRPRVDPFQSHASRSLFNRLPWLLLPGVGQFKMYIFIPPDDGGSMHLWNVDLLQCDYTALHPRRQNLTLAAVRTWNLTYPVSGLGNKRANGQKSSSKTFSYVSSSLGVLFLSPATIKLYHHATIRFQGLVLALWRFFLTAFTVDTQNWR
jgi:hypothetical protein